MCVCKLSEVLEGKGVAYEIGVLVGFDAEKTVALVGRAEDVAEGARVRHVLGDERDLVHRVVVQTVLEEKKKIVFKIPFQQRKYGPIGRVLRVGRCGS